MYVGEVEVLRARSRAGRAKVGSLLADRHRLLCALAALTGGLQLTFAARWPGRTEHVAALAMGWGGALWLTWIDGHSRKRGTGSRLECLLGIALVAATWTITLVGRAEYGLSNRFLPLVAGAGLVTAAFGFRGVPGSWRELVLLSLTLLCPLPYALQLLLMPTKVTAAAAAGVIQVVGFSVVRDGAVLVFPATTMRVFDLCSGLVLMTQMATLAVLVVCLFPTTVRRAAMVLVAAIATGFVVNVARVAMLGVIASRIPSDFAYWEQYVAGSVLFPVIATVIAGVVWWTILRRRAETRAAATLAG